MKLYEINQAILDLVDPETGEITDFDALQGLSMARDEKIENLCLWYKNLSAEAKAIKDEADSLYARSLQAQSKAEKIKEFIQYTLEGQPFEAPRVVVKFRKSARCVTDPEFVEWAEKNADGLLSYKAPTPSLKAIKEAIKAGAEVKYARIEETSSMSIK